MKVIAGLRRASAGSGKGDVVGDAAISVLFHAGEYAEREEAGVVAERSASTSA